MMKILNLGTIVTASFLFVAVVGQAQAQNSYAEKLAAADIVKGEKLFKKCKACHTVDKGGKNKVGPNLFNVMERSVASLEGFKYSKGIKAYGGEWTGERLDKFLKKPKAEIKKTKMIFAGLRKEQDRLNVIAYLKTFSDDASD